MNRCRIYLAGVGGQGTLFATMLLAEATLYAGVNALVNEIHGMSQRGGVVESTVIVGDIKSSIISDGEADALIGFEPVETYRALKKCSVDSVVVSNTAPVIPHGVAIGKEIYPDVDKLLASVHGQVRELITVDAPALANKAGSILSANVVMLGAFARSAVLPVPKEAFEHVIRTKTKAGFVETNLRAFDFGFAKISPC